MTSPGQGYRYLVTAPEQKFPQFHDGTWTKLVTETGSALYSLCSVSTGDRVVFDPWITGSLSGVTHRATTLTCHVRGWSLFDHRKQGSKVPHDRVCVISTRLNNHYRLTYKCRSFLCDGWTSETTLRANGSTDRNNEIKLLMTWESALVQIWGTIYPKSMEVDTTRLLPSFSKQLFAIHTSWAGQQNPFKRPEYHVTLDWTMRVWLLFAK